MMIPSLLVRLANRVAYVDRIQRFHAGHNVSAANAYRAIVAQDPGRALAPAARRTIDAYARDLLGSAVYAPWLMTYAAFCGRFIEGWIPYNYLRRVVSPALQGPRQPPIPGMKTLARRILATDLLPDVASCVRGCWLDRDGAPLTPEQIETLLFAEDDEIIAKVDHSGRGSDVLRVTRDRFDRAAIERLGDVAIQRVVRPSRFFDDFVRGPLATIRIATAKGVGEPARYCGAYLRFGRTGEPILAAEQAIRVPVLDREGTLGDDGALPGWERCTTHPDSGASFANRQIPAFAEAVTACLALHDGAPHQLLVGWDVAIDETDRPQLLEWNTVHPNIKFLEASTGPHFADLGWEGLWRPAAA